MGIFTNAGGMFMAKTQRDLEHVRARLAEAEAAIGPLERQLADVAFAVAMSDDYAPATALQRQLDVARGRVGVLRSALRVAEAAERQRLAESRDKEQRSRLRALRQHLAARQSAAGEYEKAVAALVTAYDKLQAATASANALLPPGIAGQSGYFTLTERATERLAHRELARQGHRRGTTPYLPGSAGADLGGEFVHQLAPLTAAIKEAAERDAAAFARYLDLAPPLPPKAPIERRINDSPPAGSERWYQLVHPAEGTPEWFAKHEREAAAAPPAEPEQPEEKPDLLTAVPEHFQPPPMPPAGPLNPHEPGTPAFEGYARELAAILASNAADEIEAAPDDAAETSSAPPQSTEEGPAALPVLDDADAPPGAPTAP